MKKLTLKAGIPSLITEQGQFFRILASSAEVNIEFESSIDGGQWRLNTPLLSGIGLNFVNRPSPFTAFTVTSDIDQTIEYFAGLDQADDDRLAASATVVVSTAGKTASVPGKQTLTDLVGGHVVLSNRNNRRSASFSIDKPCYLFDKDNGVLLPSGIHHWENHSALTLVPTVNPTEFRALEETE